MRFLSRERSVRSLSASPTLHSGLIESLERGTRALLVREVADIFRVTPGTVYRLARKHIIPGSFRIGGTVLFNPQKLAQWMRGGGA